MSGMSKATGEFTARIDGARNTMGRLTATLAGIDLARNAIDGMQQAFSTLSDSGLKLDSQMHDLSAVAGVTGGTLRVVAYPTKVRISKQITTISMPKSNSSVPTLEG